MQRRRSGALSLASAGAAVCRVNASLARAYGKALIDAHAAEAGRTRLQGASSNAATTGQTETISGPAADAKDQVEER